MQIGFIGRRSNLSKDHKKILRDLIRQISVHNDVQRFHFADIKGANSDSHDILVSLNCDYELFDMPILLYCHPTLCASERAYCIANYTYPARDDLGTVFKDIADFSDILIIESEEDYRNITEYAKNKHCNIMFLPKEIGIQCCLCGETYRNEDGDTHIQKSKKDGRWYCFDCAFNTWTEEDK